MDACTRLLNDISWGGATSIKALILQVRSSWLILFWSTAQMIVNSQETPGETAELPGLSPVPMQNRGQIDGCCKWLSFGVACYAVMRNFNAYLRAICEI